MRGKFSNRLPQNKEVAGKMPPKYWVPDGVVALSHNVASELIRRGRNSNDQFLYDRLEFLAGRLPTGEVDNVGFQIALNDTLSISADRSEEIVALAVGAFGEARYYF